MSNRAVFDLQLMAAGEIMQYIPPATIESIKTKDAHPLYRAYIVGEEGEAQPNVVGFGGRVLNWLRASISAMVSKLQYGTKIFHNHAATNDHSGRTVVGEVVGKALEYVGNKMRAVAVTYIYPEFRDIKADAVSIEAEIEMDASGRSNVIDGVHVLGITGIAVGDSRYNKPAFPSAGLISQLQAFEIQGDNTGGMMEELNFEKVKDYIMVRRLRPSEIFNDDQLKQDKTIQALLKAEFDMRDRTEKELTSVKNTSAEKIMQLESKNKDLTKTILTGKAHSLAQTIIAERKMPESKAKFILDLKMPEFKIEGDILDDAVIKTQLDKFIDTKVDEYNKLEAVFVPGKPSDKKTDADPNPRIDNGLFRNV